MIARIAAAILLAWLIGFIWFAGMMPGPADLRTTDAIVVPTGSPDRVRRGFALLADHRAKRMLVSGTDRRVRPIELAAAFHASPALVACCVDLGREAVDTRTNGGETAAWVRQHHFRSVRLVTTDWHMRRARFELSRALADQAEILPDAVPSEPDLTTLLKEYSKYLLSRASAIVGL